MQKLERVLGILRSRELDCLAIFSASNILYITSSDAPSAVLVFSGGEVVSLAPRLEYLRALEEVRVGEVLAYAKWGEPSEYERLLQGDLYDAVRAVLQERGARRVGAAGASLEVRQKLSERLGTEVLDVSKEFQLLRRSKDREELKAMRAAVSVAEEAMRLAIDLSLIHI